MPMNQEHSKRKLSGILSADVVGYSRLMQENEDFTIKSLGESKKFIGDLIEEYKGRVVDAPGDNILAEFSSVVNAVDCAVKIQDKLQRTNALLPEKNRMDFRIGVNLGDVIDEDGKIYGDGVNIAARIEGLAKPGTVCISRPLFALQKHQVTGKFLCVSKHGLDDRIPFCASDDPHADPVADALHSKCGVCQNRGLARCPIELEHKDLCLVDMGGPLVGP